MPPEMALAGFLVSPDQTTIINKSHRSNRAGLAELHNRPYREVIRSGRGDRAGGGDADPRAREDVVDVAAEPAARKRRVVSAPLKAQVEKGTEVGRGRVEVTEHDDRPFQARHQPDKRLQLGDPGAFGGREMCRHDRHPLPARHDRTMPALRGQSREQLEPLIELGAAAQRLSEGATSIPEQGMEDEVQSGKAGQLRRLVDFSAAIDVAIYLLKSDHIGVASRDRPRRAGEVEATVSTAPMVDVEGSHHQLHVRVLSDRPCDHYEEMDPVGTPVQQPETGEETCYEHPNVPTRLHCTRCDKPICGRCAIPASVGQHCPRCVAEARRNQPRVRSALRAGAPVTWSLIVANIICYVLQQVIPGFTTRFFAFGPLIAQGEWYRMITSMFLHASIIHIGFNMMALYYFGPAVEQAFGPRRFLALYFATGFMASVASFLLIPALVPSLGASGAIFGIFGVVMAMAFARRHRPEAREVLRQLVFLLILNVVLMAAVPHINLWAHAGGLISGVTLGYVFDRYAGSRSSAAIQALATIAVVAVGIVLTVAHASSFG